jgi:hypothetical protein
VVKIETVDPAASELVFDLANGTDFDGNPATEPMYYFGTCTGNAADDTVAVATSISFNYEMFGNSYRIDFQGVCE